MQLGLFTIVKSPSVMFNILIKNPFFITSHKSIQKRWNKFTSIERANGSSGFRVDPRQFLWHPFLNCWRWQWKVAWFKFFHANPSTDTARFPSSDTTSSSSSNKWIFCSVFIFKVKISTSKFCKLSSAGSFIRHSFPKLNEYFELFQLKSSFF